MSPSNQSWPRLRPCASLLLVVLFLVPLPAYALTFSSWSLSNATGAGINPWSFTSTFSPPATTSAAASTFDLFVQGGSTPGMSTKTFSISGSVTPAAGESALKVTIASLNNLQLTAGSLTFQIQVGGNNMFSSAPFYSTATQPPSSLSGGPISLNSGSNAIRITFTFDGDGSWTGTSSSPVRFTFF